MLVDPAAKWLDSDIIDEKTIQQANLAIQDGVTHVLWAPSLTQFPALSAEQLIQKAEYVQNELNLRGIPLSLYSAMVLPLVPTLPEWIDQDLLLFADVGANYLLVEFPEEVPSIDDLHRLIFDCLRRHLRLIFLAPEENPYLSQHPEEMTYLQQQGCYFMIKAGNYLEHGTRYLLIKKWMEEEKVHLVASFNKIGESYRLSRTYEEISKEFGHSFSFELEMNAKALVNGEAFITNFSLEAKERKSIFSWLWPFGKH